MIYHQTPFLVGAGILGVIGLAGLMLIILTEDRGVVVVAYVVGFSIALGVVCLVKGLSP